MGSDYTQDRPASIEKVSSGEVDVESNNIDSLEVFSSGGETMIELENAFEIVPRLELDIACSSEKLVNLNILVMHVASRENEFEAFALEEEHTLEGSILEALEFDLLYGILDSEVRELENFLSTIQSEIVSSREVVSSATQLGDIFVDMEDRLKVCEDSLKQSFEQVSDIMMQSANFRRILSASFGDEKRKGGKELSGLEGGSLSDSYAKIKMQTAEQQRSILKMLEKSLAREMDLEKRLTEARETVEDLKLRLQQEAFSSEQEAEDMWGRLLEAENSAEILLGISKELFGKIQMAQFSINGFIQREGESRSKLQDLSEQLKEKDSALQVSESSRTELVEKVNSLEQKLREFESQLHHLKDASEQNAGLREKASKAEKRAEIAEAECRLLRESNMELNTYLSHLKNSIANANNRVEQLESQLKESEIERVHAVASVEATQEKQSMLDCTIKDMENLIEDLKSKVLRAESLTESAEEKCIILSESNAELVEEINFLRRRMEHLETSLHQADEAKKETAKDITVRTKLITDLVLQLAVERERLHKQISSLMKDKKAVAKYLQQMKDLAVTAIGSGDANVKEAMLSEKEAMLSENDIKNGETSKEVKVSSSISSEASNTHGDLSTTTMKTSQDDSTSDNDTVRNIDARQLKLKYVCTIVLIFMIPAFAAFVFSAIERS